MLPLGKIDNLRSWLTETHQYWLTYHNHKETSAWLAVAGYLALIVGLANAGLPITSNTILQVVFTALVLTIGFGFLWFVRRQLQLRRTGGLLATTASRLQTNLFLDSISMNLTDKDFEIQDIPKGNIADDISFFNKLLYIKYRKPDGKWPTLFAKEFQETVNIKPGVGEGDENRFPLEMFPQLLILIGTLTYLAAIWLSFCGIK
jgi:hypothetical protein